MSRIAGVVSAIVSSFDDPAQVGRVQVQFDWMDGAPQSYWARVAAPMAGGGRGAFFMPELNDEVLVSFDQGDVSHPYIIGYCWSNADKPPFSATHTTRGIQTVSGHYLTFDDSDAATITLQTNEGNKLVLNDHDGSITIETSDQVTVELDAASSSDGQRVAISLPTGNSITLDPTGVTVNVASGEVNVSALSTTISSPSVTIDAATTTITGVLTVAGIVTAGGVSAPTYTEGIGNFI